MKFQELVDRNIRRVVTQIKYDNDVNELNKAIMERKPVGLQAKDDYLVGTVSPNHFEVIYRKTVRSKEVDYLSIEIEVKIICLMNMNARKEHNFRNMDIDQFVKENENIIFLNVGNTVSTIIANITAPFGNVPIVFPPNIKFN